MVFAYPAVRVSNWYFDGQGLGWLHLGGLWAAGTAAMLYSFSGPRPIVRFITVHWMGVSFVMLSLTLLYELLRMVLPIDDSVGALWIMAGTTLLVVLAVGASHFLGVRYLGIDSQRVSRKTRIVQLSDVHIGSRQGGFLHRIVRRVNRLAPDVVVITGDLVDTSAVGMQEMRALGELEAPVLFSIGNHERYADLEKILGILEGLGVQPLRQQSTVVADVQFIGIDDADDPGQVAAKLPAVERRQGPFTVLLYHRPNGWDDAIEQGIDLMLSGHTHNGQIFPFNLVVRQQFRQIRGLYLRDGHRLYVSPGTGTWGPFMRLGSTNEITCFDLKPVTP